MVAAHDEFGRQAVENEVEALIAERRYGLINLAVVGLDGKVAWSSPQPIVGMTLAGQEFFKAILKPNPPPHFVGMPTAGLGANDGWVLNVSSPIRDDAGAVTGVALVSVNAGWLNNALARLIAAPGQTIAIRRSEDGRIRATSRATTDEIAQRYAEQVRPDHPVVRAARTAPTGRMEFRATRDGRRLLNAWRSVPLVGQVVSVSLDWDRMFAPYRRMAISALLAVAALALGTLAVAIGWNRNAQLRTRLETVAARDSLTGLDTRRAFEAKAARVMEHCSARQHGFACLLFDLDHFKRINDQHGHDVGDAVLKQVALALQAGVRADDIVCRWGGEEVLVLLSKCGRTDAGERAEALRAAVGAIRAVSLSSGSRVTTSVGVACFPDDGEDLAHVIRSADRALYRAKAAGRDRVALAARREDVVA
jgi:diguanylate cyclase (GGDEF)-like protein